MLFRFKALLNCQDQFPRLNFQTQRKLEQAGERRARFGQLKLRYKCPVHLSGKRQFILADTKRGTPSF